MKTESSRTSSTILSLYLALIGVAVARPDEQVAVYHVTQTGATTAQATNLAAALNIDPRQLQMTNGWVSFLDHANYLAVPTVGITNPATIHYYLAETQNKFPAIPLRLEGLDFAALSNLTVLDTNVALNLALTAFRSAGLEPQFGQPVAGHARFSAAYTNVDGTVTSCSRDIDTIVRYEFSLPNGYPLVGPGAQVQLTYGPTGTVARLHYATRQLAEGSPVAIVPPSEIIRRVARYLPPDEELELKVVYWSPPFEWPGSTQSPDDAWTVTDIIPWYSCTPIVNQIDPTTGAVVPGRLTPFLIPATDDAAFVPTAVLSVAFDTNTAQVVASVSVAGGKPPYRYVWAGSDPAVTGNAGPAVRFRPLLRVPPLFLSIRCPPEVTNGVTISWPEPAPGFVLEATDNLVTPAWNAVATAIQTNNGLQTISLPAVGRARYFRLHVGDQPERVTVMVTDANGVSVWASQTLTVQVVPVTVGRPTLAKASHEREADPLQNESPARALSSRARKAMTQGAVPSVYYFGCESPHDTQMYSNFAFERSEWQKTMGAANGGGGTERFCWTGYSSWPGDYIEPTAASSGKNPAVWGCADYLNWGVNTADIVFHIGHGCSWSIAFSYPPADGYECTSFLRYPATKSGKTVIWHWQNRGGPEVSYNVPYTKSWKTSSPGAADQNDHLRWLSLDSCLVLMGPKPDDEDLVDNYETAPNPANPEERWGPAFGGLHLMMGFKTTGDAQTYSSFASDYAQGILGTWPICLGPCEPFKILQAWFNSLSGSGMGSPAAIGPIGLDGVTDQNDHYWGKGEVGPDIRNPSGFWHMLTY